MIFPLSLSILPTHSLTPASCLFLNPVFFLSLSFDESERMWSIQAFQKIKTHGMNVERAQMSQRETSLNSRKGKKAENSFTKNSPLLSSEK